MKRTEKMTFEDFEESGYEYSDGETSEDLKKDKTNGNGSPRVVINKQIQQHLESIDTTICKNSQFKIIAPFMETDFNLEKTFKFANDSFDENVFPTETVFMLLPHPAQFVKTENHDNAPFMAWQNTNSPFAEFSTAVNSLYKQAYMTLKQQLQINFLVSPSAEKLNSLSSFRRDGPNGRVLFHYIGYGFPPIDKSLIYLCDGKPNVFKPYQIKKLFENIKTPSCFIFDCNCAGSVIPNIIAVANKFKEKSMAQKKTSKQIPTAATQFYQQTTNWDDWFCICATDSNENLPTDPHLPRDFLTTCLFNPVSLSILCHILQYYRTSFPDPSFPLNELNGILAFNENNHLHQLEAIIQSLTDSIAADFLKPALFTSLFRKDRLLSTFFRNFILAQYLLSPYEVHPVSHPAIPSMVKHPLWMQWHMFIDQWITSTLTPPPSFAYDFFSRAICSFNNFLSNNMDDKIKRSILTIMCHMPFVDIPNRYEAFSKLAIYAERSQNNQAKLAVCVIFHSMFSVIPSIKDQQDLQSLCYLVLALLKNHPFFVYEIRKEMDYGPLFTMIFDQNIDEKTRTLICAILSFIVTSLKNSKSVIKTEDFMKSLKQSIITVKSPILLQWLLIFTKRAFEGTVIDMKYFVPESLHFQIAVLVFHNSLWCRASAISCLSLFSQPGDQIINMHLILMIIPAFMDPSIYVRLQVLHFSARYISQNTEMFIIGFKKSRLSNSPLAYTQLLAMWYDGLSLNSILDNISELAIKSDEIAHRNDAIQYICQILYYIIDMYSHDPHPYIKRKATKARSFFQHLAVGEHGTEARSHSISPPYGREIHASKFHTAYSEDESEITEESEYIPIETDSESLFVNSLDRLVRGGLDWNVPSYEPHVEDLKFKSKLSVEIRADSRPFKFPPTHIAFHPETLNIAVSTNNKWVFHADENCNITSKVRLSDYEVTGLGYTVANDIPFVIAGTSDGSIHLWDPKMDSPCACFRADTNYNIDNVAQLLAAQGTQLFTARGNSGIALWDLGTQKLIGEWMSDEQHIATAIGLQPNNPSLAVVGYSNGSLNCVDIREPSSKIRRLTVSLGDQITNLSGNGDLIYVGTSKGKCAIWDSVQGKLSMLSSSTYNIKRFTTHRSLPIIIMSESNHSPKLAGPDGVPIHTFDQVAPNSIFALHDVLPIVAFGTQSGELITYRLH